MDMMEEYYLVCEDSLEGIFTGIYDAYLKKMPHDQIHICVGEEENYRLFAVYETCVPDEKKTASVAKTIIREFGRETYLSVCRALASGEADKGEAVYKTVVTGFSMKNKKELMGNLSNPFVHRVFELARFTANEAHYHVEFLRFKELESGILYAEIGPKNNVLTFIVPHFADRLPLENFVIYDEKRDIYAVHPSKMDWYLVVGDEKRNQQERIFSQGEKKYSELFSCFFHTIAIKERASYGRQRNMLPLRYRQYMTEFQENKGSYGS
ncbi:TIGR03915 family putative DNA repair protein [Romboutsia ilealis]|uniref:TIGR03915 family putative DNA repair protein n=1 Tax=Romboutsia ilealis TaxID=1115758 RepID=UPI00272CFA65|nr:TIGR03915 family putative DNA repair protein [Romboutsia ilealis]